MLPLNGVKVLDLSRILAGPYAAQILGDLGAEVIKVESPEGDETRRWGPPFIGDNAAYYFSANRNKSNISANFNAKEELAHVQKLAREADVIIENYKTGNLKKFGLDYESLKPTNPKLIYCSITGYGQTGSRSTKPGFDAMIQAETGLMSITGSPDHPSKVGVPIADLTTGLYAVIAIQAALIERQQSGQGQNIDLALFDVQTSLLTNVAMNYLVSGNTPQPMGSSHPNIVPYQLFNTADFPLFIAVGSDSQFAQLCAALEIPLHQDDRYNTNQARVSHRDELVELIEGRLKNKTREDWLKILHEKKVPSSPLNDLPALATDITIKEKDLFTKMDDGKTPCLRSPIRFSRTPITRYKTPATKPERSHKGFNQ